MTSFIASHSMTAVASGKDAVAHTPPDTQDVPSSLRTWLREAKKNPSRLAGRHTIDPELSLADRAVCEMSLGFGIFQDGRFFFGFVHYAGGLLYEPIIAASPKIGIHYNSGGLLLEFSNGNKSHFISVASDLIAWDREVDLFDTAARDASFYVLTGEGMKLVISKPAELFFTTIE